MYVCTVPHMPTVVDATGTMNALELDLQTAGSHHMGKLQLEIKL